MSITMQIYNTYICPNTNALMDLGSTTKQWKDLYIEGLAYIDGLGEDLDVGDYDFTSVDTLYGVDSSIYIDMGVDGTLSLVADNTVQLSGTYIDISGDITLSGGTTITDSLTLNADLTLSEYDIITDTVVGTQIGTLATQKLGFWGATPVVQQSHIANPTESGQSLDTAVEAILLALEAVGILASA